MSFDVFTALATLAQAGTQIGTGVAAYGAAKDQARQARLYAAMAKQDELRKGRALAGKQRALYGKAGVEIDEGTPLDVLAQTSADAETNAIRAALFYENQADQLKATGKIALTQGILGAGSTILGKAETFRDVYNSYTSGSGSSYKPTTYRGGFSAESIARAAGLA